MPGLKRDFVSLQLTKTCSLERTPETQPGNMKAGMKLSTIQVRFATGSGDGMLTTPVLSRNTITFTGKTYI